MKDDVQAAPVGVVKVKGDLVADLDSSLTGLSATLNSKGVTEARAGEPPCKRVSLRRLSLKSRNMIIKERTASTTKGTPIIAPSGSDREDGVGTKEDDAGAEEEEVGIETEEIETEELEDDLETELEDDEV